MMRARRTTAFSWALAGTLGVLSFVAPGRVQGEPVAAAGSTLTLEEMVSTTLANSTELRLAAVQVDMSIATKMAAAEPFDSAIAIVATGTQTHQFSPPAAPPSTALIREVTGSASWSRRFRNGLTIAPEVSASGTRIHEQPPLEVGQLSARLRLTAPLLRDRGGAITEAPEQAAGVDHAASVMEAQQAEADILLQAAAAYWSYLAAERNLEVLTASEERARRTVEETAALVKADERTGSDLIQAQGYHSSRRAARIGAEQQRLEAARRLAILTGVLGDRLSPSPRAITEFPEPRPAPYEDLGRRWIAEAIRRRPDLAAAHLRLRSAEVRLGAARNELSARLDLEVSAGYTGQARGLAGQLHRDFPGAEAGMTIRYQLPIERTGSRGRLAQSSALFERERIARAEIERRISIGVSAAFNTVKNSQLALRELAEAVKLLQRTVENEKKKFRLGSATLFSINQAEESLTSALLAMIEGRREFAVALATLRFETGTVFPDKGAGPARRRSAEIATQLLSFPQ